MECPNCKKMLADNAKSCPDCGYDFTEKKNPFLGCLGTFIGVIVFLGVLGSIGINGGEEFMKNVEQSVALDQEQQYQIAKNQGDKMQICVQAGLVSAAYLQANDQENFNKWKSIEKKDCRAAGLSY